MKKLFVLTALAGMAAFQVGCGDSAPAPAGKSGAGPASGPAAPMTTAGGKPGMPYIAGDETKKSDGDKAKDEPAAADDAAPAKDDDAPKE